tara:strand:- start:2378 stop:2581 length:204 start_codon:yes stop_codon:yes gene_type:complete
MFGPASVGGLVMVLKELGKIKKTLKSINTKVSAMEQALKKLTATTKKLNAEQRDANRRLEGLQKVGN